MRRLPRFVTVSKSWKAARSEEDKKMVKAENMNEITQGIVVSSRVRLARNVVGIPFPSKKREQKPYDTLINQVYSALSKAGKFEIYKMANLQPAEAEALKEKHLISSDLIAAKAGAALINADESISVMVNEEDHIRAQSIQNGFGLAAAYRELDKIDDLLSEKLPIAFDAELGYLTSCPTNLGTGMRASVMMFLPALTIDKTISSIINALPKLGLTVRGVYGEGSSATGFLYQISNQVSLGVTELDIIKNVEAAVIKICSAEKLARQNLMEKNPLEIKDRVFRAYGILTNCARLTTGEFMTLISEVKLGAYLKIVNVSDIRTIDEVIDKCQPANIVVASQKQLSPTERDIYRAEYVAKALKSIVTRT